MKVESAKPECFSVTLNGSKHRVASVKLRTGAIAYTTRVLVRPGYNRKLRDCLMHG